jgi:PAS domain S-box-containing protein
MKISFENKILAGFIINLLVVVASGWIFIARLEKDRDLAMDSTLNWIELSLFILSIILLIIVYYIIRAQLRAKTVSQNLLLENKQLLQSIIDNTSNPIFIKKINGEYLLVNKQFESLFQISNENILGKTDHDFLPKEIADGYRNSDFEVVKALKELKTEEIIQQTDGPHTYIAVKFPLYDSKGRIYAIGGISTDISERKKLEESFKATDKFFHMSLEMMIIASKDKFIKINPAVSRILGYSEQELLNRPFIEFTYAEDREITQKEVLKLQAGALTFNFENRYVCKDGTIKWLSWSTFPDPSSGLLYAVANDITNQKENEKSLKIAEEFFMISFDMFVIIENDNFVKVNPAFTRILGYDQKDILNKSFLEFTHPEDAKVFEDVIKKLKISDSVINHRCRALCKNGSYKWLDWSSTIDLQTGVVYAVANDVSEIIESEESLKMVNTFFNMSSDLLVVAKGERFIKINPAFTKVLGYSQTEMNAISFLSLSTDPERAREAVSRLEKGETMVNFIDFAICKDGSNKWINWNATVDLETGLMFGVAHDITQMKKNEEMLNNYTQKIKENEQQIQAIFEGAPDPVIVIDSDSNILRWNPKAESVFGWAMTEVIGKPLYEFIVPVRYRESHKKGMNEFLKSQIAPFLSKATEIEAVNKQGTEFPVSLSISPIKIGENYIFVGFVRDITENQKMLDELLENEEKLSLIIDNIGEGVIVANAEKEVVIANNMANEIFGIEENEKMPISLTEHFELYYPDEKTVFPSQNLPMERALNGEETNDVDVVLWDPAAKEKKRVLISGRSLVDQNNKVVYAVVTIKDISKYKQMEEELKDTEMKYRKLIGFRKSNDKEA